MSINEHFLLQKGNVSKLHHAYLLFGPSGGGKFETARTCAERLEEKALLTDALIIEPTENKISIDEVRQIKRFLSHTPIHSPKRTVIIKNAECLTWQAQPALLKIVEEPPKSALIIFTARDPEVLSPALRSRLHKFFFPSPTIPTSLPVIPSKQKRAEESQEPSLPQEIEQKIIELYSKNRSKHAHHISFLLKKLESATRFNLNPKIQRKAINI